MSRSTEGTTSGVTKECTGTGARRSLLRKSIFACLLLVLPLAVLLAVHNDGFFELGNVAGASGSADILGSGAQPGPDWEDLFTSTGALKDSDHDGTPDAVEVYGGLAAQFIQDDRSTSNTVDRTTFAGSNKNNDAISTWNWDTGNNPPKDDLVNTYSYAEINSSGELIIYAGLERLDE